MHALKQIAITRPDFWAGEPDRINQLMRERFFRIHIRKPKASSHEIEMLLQAIDPIYYKNLSLHDHFELASTYELGGIHLNFRNPTPPQPSKHTLIISRSCHSLAEVDCVKKDFDYVFLSPIFDSISKQGYTSNFTRAQLIQASQRGLIDEKVFALGGINNQTIKLLKEMGFGGIAMLGALW